MRFGTSGLRGLVVEMTDAAVSDYVRAFVQHLAAQGAAPTTALVGRDLRPSSTRIAAACRAAIRAAGVDCIDCGATPTPALALEAAARGAPAVMVTGSHIPFDRNGLKFYTPDGEITKEDEVGILAQRAVAQRPSCREGAEIAGSAVLARYRDRNLAILPDGALTGLRIGVYQHSAVGRDLLVEAFRLLGAQTIPLGRTEAFAPLDTEAVRPEDVAQARVWTRDLRLDALVSTDGDGDRPLIADERGAFIRGDVIGLLTARAIGADAVATPISSSTALERSGWVERVARTRIGSPFVIEMVRRLSVEGARLAVGYEANGGFLLGGAWTPKGRTQVRALLTRDAMLPILTLLGEAARRNLALSALVAETPPRFTASDRLTEIAPARSIAWLERLARAAPLRARLARMLGVETIIGVDTLDGVRMTLPGDQIAHLRASGNAPELRAYAEAAAPERADAIVAALLRAAADDLAATPSGEAGPEG